LSDRVRVTSIIGRFLEHSRIWVFANAGAPEYYIGSADWMPRNLERRVECVVPVDDPAVHARLDSVLATCLADNRQAWDLAEDGSYRQRNPNGDPERGTHRILLREPWGRVADGVSGDGIMFARPSGEHGRVTESA
jgi:polyphosphate kinase